MNTAIKAAHRAAAAPQELGDFAELSFRPPESVETITISRSSVPGAEEQRQSAIKELPLNFEMTFSAAEAERAVKTRLPELQFKGAVSSDVKISLQAADDRGLLLKYAFQSAWIERQRQSFEVFSHHIRAGDYLGPYCHASHDEDVYTTETRDVDVEVSGPTRGEAPCSAEMLSHLIEALEHSSGRTRDAAKALDYLSREHGALVQAARALIAERVARQADDLARQAAELARLSEETRQRASHYAK